MSATAIELPRTGTVAVPEHAWDAHQAGTTASPGPESAADRAAVILTPDQRVRVFISSTLQELAGERAAARRAIRRLHLAPVWYESGARPHPPRSMYRAYLEQSQVFVGIYWQRYGWIAPGMDVSGLEDEYRLAAGKPMLLYLKRPAPDQEPRMKTFIDSIRDAGAVSYRPFATTRELERLLADDLAIMLSESFHDAATGIGAPRVPSARPSASAAADLPAGTVTFVCTGIEGSARLWETEPGAMARSVALHDQTLRAAFERHGGVVFSAMSDGMAVAFPSAIAAGRAVLEAQRVLSAAPWPDQTGALKVRMGLSTEEAVPRDGQYAYQLLNRCARLAAAAHGGQIVMSAATEALVRSGLPDGATLIDLGERRLRGLTDPMRIFQIAHPDLPRAHPAVRSQDASTGNLPVQVSSFIGRARELKLTTAALSGARVVTLTGAGGVGKTRLALQVAAQVAPRFSDGTWLCELASVRDGACVDDAVAAVFSVTAPAGQTTREALVDYLRHKELLLVLDNCEHLVAGAATLAGVLQRSCARLGILATSREGLGIDGERLIPVPSLALPAADDSLQAIRHAEAVRLFAERAAAVKPDFRVTAGNAAAVAAVCRRLDGVPMAIELAAARVPAMTLAELARRLDRSFAVLAGARRGAAWSWAIKTGHVNTAFSILAGFAPCEVWNSYPLLFPGTAALELPGATGHPGYPLALAVSALFASIRADGTGAEELCRRAADANARLDTPEWRVEELICAARQNIANTRGAFADAARLAEQAAGIARAGGDLADASVELTIAVADYVLVYDVHRALPLASEALALARQIGAPALIATGLLAVGVAVAVTDPGRARACLRESRELSTALGYRSAIDLVWATAIASLTHDRAGTLELGRRAVRGLQRGGDRLRMAIILHIIADALAETQPAPAAIIHGAADAYTVAPPNPAGPISPTAQAALGEERTRELRTHGADMDWDQAVAYTLTRITQALDELQPERHHHHHHHHQAR